MNSTHSVNTFLEMLKEDSAEYRQLEINGLDLAEKKKMIRSLMNIRMPNPVSNELLNLQDAYLKNELSEKGIVTLADIPTIKEQFNSTFPYSDKISIWQGDITRLKTGAIVNAANSQMLGCFVPCHKCIDNAIHSSAGMQLREECSRIMNQRRILYGKNYEEPTGTATLTSGYNLPCNYVIHTVGQIVHDKLNEQLCQNLINCYETVLKCCVKNKIRSVAFCCISTGEFHFPNEEAARIACRTTAEFLSKQGEFIDRIIFNVFKDSDKAVYESLLC